MEPCAAPQSAAATNGRFLGWGGGDCFPPSQTRGAHCGCHQTHASSQNHDPVGSWPEPAGAARQWPHAPSTMRRGGGRMHLSPAGLARGRFHHASTRAYASGSGEGARSSRSERAIFRVEEETAGPVRVLAERRRTSAAAARVRVYRFPPLSWGSVSTVSICNSIAPHGRARPRGCDANGTG